MNDVATVNDNSISTRTPFLIAAEINSIKDQTRNIVLFNSIEIGRRLVEAKAVILHGAWGEWLKSAVDYSQSTANNLMKIFEEYGANQLSFFGDNANSQALGNLSYTQAVALLGIPQEEREAFVNDNDLENMSTRQLQQAIKEKIDLEKKLLNANDTVNQISYERDKLREETSNLASNIRLTDQVLKTTQADVKMLQEALEKERQRTKSEVERLGGLLEQAKASGKDEEVTNLQLSLDAADKELRESIDKVVDLERQLNEKPIDLPAIVEKVPEDIERELNELRQKVKQQSNPAALKFGIHFEAIVSDFNTLLGTLTEIKEIDLDAHEKYKGAVKGLINKMSERL